MKKHTKSSGNIFADLDLPNPKERLRKASVAIQIDYFIKENQLTEEQVAKILDVSLPSVSALLDGKLAVFSIDYLFKFLMTLRKCQGLTS